MSRGDQILRQWNLLRCLQSRGTGVPLKQLAEEAEDSERTIQRDFEILQAAGFPLESEQDEIGKKYWRMPHKFIQNGPLVLSLTESISLHCYRRVCRLAVLHYFYCTQPRQILLDNHQTDKYRLCCCRLMVAEFLNCRVLLNCLTCGTIWQRKPDGTLDACHLRYTYLGMLSVKLPVDFVGKH